MTKLGSPPEKISGKNGITGLFFLTGVFENVPI
jgi:hypothetical protein